MLSLRTEVMSFIPSQHSRPTLFFSYLKYISVILWEKVTRSTDKKYKIPDFTNPSSSYTLLLYRESSILLHIYIFLSYLLSFHYTGNLLFFSIYIYIYSSPTFYPSTTGNLLFFSIYIYSSPTFYPSTTQGT